MRPPVSQALLLLLIPIACMPSSRADDSTLLTAAERSGFQATARHDEILALCKALDDRSDLVRQEILGTTAEGRPIPLLVVGDPDHSTFSSAREARKLVVLLIGNIHAGEVCGKEALPALVRDLVTSPSRPEMFDRLVLLVVPSLNPDGNERVRPDNRPGQLGPAQGMGQRANAQGLDLNRDFVKLESPEIRSLVALINRWDPEVVIDTHTTNGSLHRYVLTYQGPQNPAGDHSVRDYVRNCLLPQVDTRFEQSTGKLAFFYGDFDPSHSRWVGYPDTPRFGGNYVGLRDRIAILSEAYAYAPYEDRVKATQAFVSACITRVAEEADSIRKLLDSAREPATTAPDAPVAIRSVAEPFSVRQDVFGYVEEQRDGKLVPGEPHDYSVELVQNFRPVLEVKRPYAYVVPPQYAAAIQALQRHGLEARRFRETVWLDVASTTVRSIRQNDRDYQAHRPLEIEATEPAAPRARPIPAGSVLIRADQALGNLAVYLLEARSADGLATWNAFDAGLAVGLEYPVLRLEREPSFPIALAALPPLPEDQPPKRRVTFETMLRGPAPDLSGSTPRIAWLDPEHWLIDRAGKPLRVEARTGRSEPLFDMDPLVRALDELPELDSQRARSIAQGAASRLDPTRQGFVFEHEGDLYHARLDGSHAVRLTRDPGTEELATPSPDGKKVAFIRDNDLFLADVATGTEKRLTREGSDLVRHGKADWVYYEEIFNRDWKAYWWSPDSSTIAFLECDDRPLDLHSVLIDTSDPRKVESTPYPRAGTPNPFVRLGIVAVEGDPAPLWADLPREVEGQPLLISAVGWLDGRSAYCYAQNRIQTWLDLVRIDAGTGKSTTLFRDTTGAWVENPGEVRSLADGGFLFPSERTGWKHLYRYNADGTNPRALTSGEWEVRDVELIDEPDGWVYFTATRDAPMAPGLYRTRLEGGPVERLTRTQGSHRPSVSPDGSLFVDTHSTIDSPPRSALFDETGNELRTLDANPIPDLARYDLAPRRRVQIPAPDGFLLEAEVVEPPSLDPVKSYPAWFMTYAGPHFPSVSDGWGGSSRLMDQALASEGFFVFRMDPRSASGKGAVSAHAAYKQLGISELKDIETGIAWLKKEYPQIDPDRIGMSGHSYGGFMTSFAMTHSRLFAAGIAGAPVTDWHDYDSIYTERFMLTPEENPEGYRETSVVRAAPNLHGRLLLLHGTIDDNVSLRNTMRFVHALQQADRDFELMLYPAARHGIFGRHYQRLQVEFMKRTLGGPSSRPEPAP